MTDIAIPPEALEAAARAAHDKWRHDCAEQQKEPVENWLEWHELEDFEQEDWRRQARAACLAMLRAWPGAIHNGHWLLFPHTKLPLPMENTNAEA